MIFRLANQLAPSRILAYSYYHLKNTVLMKQDTISYYLRSPSIYFDKDGTEVGSSWRPMSEAMMMLDNFVIHVCDDKP